MLIFGHTGITLATAILLEGIITKGRSLPTRMEEVTGQSQPSAWGSLLQDCHRSAASWITSLAERIDIRLLLIGSLLPDIVDKPVGYFFFGDIFSNGHIFCHTLFFLIIITLAGLYLYWNHHKTWLLVLSFGTFTHLILDRMWRNPRTLLWPLYGFSFERNDFFTLTRWVQTLFHTFLTLPAVSIPELVGTAIIVWFMWLLVRRRITYVFLESGQL